MYYGDPDFRFEGAQFEITVHGDDEAASNYTTSWRGSSQKYDFTRFDVTVDLSITGGAEDIVISGQSAQISFYNFLNESPWGDLVSLGLNGYTASGDYLSFGLRQVNQAATSVIWDTDGYITSLGTLIDPNFDPNGVVRGYLNDSNDSYAQYLTGGLQSGPARGADLSSVSVAPVPLPAGALLLLTGVGALAFGRRKKSA